MKSIRTTLLSLSLLLSAQGGSQTLNPDSISPPMNLIKKTKKPFIALAEVVGLNVGVWAIDRYALKADFAYLSSQTIRNNFTSGIVWDNDLFGTNFMLHPFHGANYYNSARSSGYDFYSSIPFALSGSLLWEFIFENEPPSLNDLMSTTAGGAAIGEVTYRLSKRIFDDSATGSKRVFKEILGTLIDPMHGLDRLFTGQAWKRVPGYRKDTTPIDWNVALGSHFLKPRMGGGEVPFAQLSTQVEYNPEYTEVEKPYDWFEFDIRANFRPADSYVNRIHILGLLWGRNWKESSSSRLDWGIYQHFDFMDSPVKEHRQTPYRTAQVLAMGVGAHYRRLESRRFTVDGKVFLTAVGLGSSLTDYYWVVDRDYNFGSGFSTALHLALSDRRSGLFLRMKADNYQLFTWRGYHPERNLLLENPKKFSIQGDKGSVNFTWAEAEVGFQSKVGLNLSFTPSFIHRSTFYQYHPNVNYTAWEYIVKVGCRI